MYKTSTQRMEEGNEQPTSSIGNKWFSNLPNKFQDKSFYALPSTNERSGVIRNRTNNTNKSCVLFDYKSNEVISNLNTLAKEIGVSAFSSQSINKTFGSDPNINLAGWDRLSIDDSLSMKCKLPQLLSKEQWVKNYPSHHIKSPDVDTTNSHLPERKSLALKVGENNMNMKKAHGKKQHITDSKCFEMLKLQQRRFGQINWNKSNSLKKNEKKNTAQMIDKANPNLTDGKDSVSTLYMWCDRNKTAPSFFFSCIIKDNCMSFLCKITIMEVSATGIGKSKKESKKLAASKILVALNVLPKESLNGQTSGQDESVDSKTEEINLESSISQSDKTEQISTPNPISRLQEICMKQKWAFPDYRAETFGSLFKCTVSLYVKTERITTSGLGQSKKNAKYYAALNALKICQDRDYISKFD